MTDTTTTADDGVPVDAACEDAVDDAPFDDLPTADTVTGGDAK